ncbi:MAG: hypothetical protein IPN00_11290 [Hydrogenophilales bacterium]|nr:hypothetical protein [Hydrogenophilales bacterium]
MTDAEQKLWRYLRNDPRRVRLLRAKGRASSQRPWGTSS